MARWKRVVNEKSDFQIQTYYDYTRHYEPEFGETRHTFDVDFLHHLVLPGNKFPLGAGRALESGERYPTCPHHRFPAAQTDGPDLQRVRARRDSPLPSPVLADCGSKFEHNNYTGFEIQPSARLLWNLSPHQSLWASVTRAVALLATRRGIFSSVTSLRRRHCQFTCAVNGDGHFQSEQLIAYEGGYRTLVAAHWLRGSCGVLQQLQRSFFFYGGLSGGRAIPRN